MTPYTYLIGWKDHNRFYYGVRFAKKCHPSELFVSYFTSSKSVKQMIQDIGTPDLIQVRKIFDNALDARRWEHRVLTRLKVIESEKWLNKTDNKAIAPMPGSLNPMFGKTGKESPRFGMKHSEESKSIIGIKSRKKKGNMPTGFADKMRSIVLGRKLKPETKSKIKNKLTGRSLSDEHIANIVINHADFSGENNPFFGKHHSELSKLKMSQKRKGKVWIHNPNLRKRLLVEINSDIMLQDGWVKGKGKWD